MQCTDHSLREFLQHLNQESHKERLVHRMHIDPRAKSSITVQQSAPAMESARQSGSGTSAQHTVGTGYSYTQSPVPSPLVPNRPFPSANRRDPHSAVENQLPFPPRKRDERPDWLDTGLQRLRHDYPNSKFNRVDELTVDRKFQVRCHDCPGKLYTVTSVSNFEAHLKGKFHGNAVELRLAGERAAPIPPGRLTAQKPPPGMISTIHAGQSVSNRPASGSPTVAPSRPLPRGATSGASFGYLSGPASPMAAPATPLYGAHNSSSQISTQQSVLQVVSADTPTTSQVSTPIDTRLPALKGSMTAATQEAAPQPSIPSEEHSATYSPLSTPSVRASFGPLSNDPAVKAPHWKVRFTALENSDAEKTLKIKALESSDAEKALKIKAVEDELATLKSEFDAMEKRNKDRDLEMRALLSHYSREEASSKKRKLDVDVSEHSPVKGAPEITSGSAGSSVPTSQRGDINLDVDMSGTQAVQTPVQVQTPKPADQALVQPSSQTRPQNQIPISAKPSVPIPGMAPRASTSTSGPRPASQSPYQSQAPDSAGRDVPSGPPNPRVGDRTGTAVRGGYSPYRGGSYMGNPRPQPHPTHGSPPIGSPVQRSAETIGHNTHPDRAALIGHRP